MRPRSAAGKGSDAPIVDLTAEDSGSKSRVGRTSKLSTRFRQLSASQRLETAAVQPGSAGKQAAEAALEDSQGAILLETSSGPESEFEFEIELSSDFSRPSAIAAAAPRAGAAATGSKPGPRPVPAAATVSKPPSKKQRTLGPSISTLVRQAAAAEVGKHATPAVLALDSKPAAREGSGGSDETRFSNLPPDAAGGDAGSGDAQQPIPPMLPAQHLHQQALLQAQRPAQPQQGAERPEGSVTSGSRLPERSKAKSGGQASGSAAAVVAADAGAAAVEKVEKGAQAYKRPLELPSSRDPRSQQPVKVEALQQQQVGRGRVSPDGMGKSAPLLPPSKRQRMLMEQHAQQQQQLRRQKSVDQTAHAQQQPKQLAPANAAVAALQAQQQLHAGCRPATQAAAQRSTHAVLLGSDGQAAAKPSLSQPRLASQALRGVPAMPARPVPLPSAPTPAVPQQRAAGVPAALPGKPGMLLPSERVRQQLLDRQQAPATAEVGVQQAGSQLQRPSLPMPPSQQQQEQQQGRLPKQASLRLPPRPLSRTATASPTGLPQSSRAAAAAQPRGQASAQARQQPVPKPATAAAQPQAPWVKKEVLLVLKEEDKGQQQQQQQQPPIQPAAPAPTSHQVDAPAPSPEQQPCTQPVKPPAWAKRAQQAAPGSDRSTSIVLAAARGVAPSVLHPLADWSRPASGADAAEVQASSSSKAVPGWLAYLLGQQQQQQAAQASSSAASAVTVDTLLRQGLAAATAAALLPGRPAGQGGGQGGEGAGDEEDIACGLGSFEPSEVTARLLAATKASGVVNLSTQQRILRWLRTRQGTVQRALAVRLQTEVHEAGPAVTTGSQCGRRQARRQGAAAAGGAAAPSRLGRGARRKK